MNRPGKGELKTKLAAKSAAESVVAAAAAAEAAPGTKDSKLRNFLFQREWEVKNWTSATLGGSPPKALLVQVEKARAALAEGSIRKSYIVSSLSGPAALCWLEHVPSGEWQAFAIFQQHTATSVGIHFQTEYGISVAKLGLTSLWSSGVLLLSAWAAKPGLGLFILDQAIQRNMKLVLATGALGGEFVTKKGLSTWTQITKSILGSQSLILSEREFSAATASWIPQSGVAQFQKNLRLAFNDKWKALTHKFPPVRAPPSSVKLVGQTLSQTRKGNKGQKEAGEGGKGNPILKEEEEGEEVEEQEDTDKREEEVKEEEETQKLAKEEKASAERKDPEKFKNLYEDAVLAGRPKAKWKNDAQCSLCGGHWGTFQEHKLLDSQFPWIGCSYCSSWWCPWCANLSKVELHEFSFHTPQTKTRPGRLRNRNSNRT